jgi:predicted nucleic acid-binding protein
MNTVLVDTSVWVDYFNSSMPSPESLALHRLLLDSGSAVCLCPVVYQEILQGVRDDKIFDDIKQLLLNFEMITFSWIRVTNHAINLYRSLRKSGITIRKSNDCLIASYAMLADVCLLHKDRDFSAIAAKSPLQLFQP